MKNIELGVGKNKTVGLQEFICPHCNVIFDFKQVCDLMHLDVGLFYSDGGIRHDTQCPFCGSKVHNRFAVKGMFTVVCSGDDCGAVVSFLGTRKKSDVANKYNKRYTGEEPSLKRDKDE